MGSTKKERELDGGGLGRSRTDLQDNQANRVGGIERSPKILCQADKSGLGSELAQIDVNPFELPSLPLSDRRKLPVCMAVYFALSEENNVLYIGRSTDLNLRWLNHHHWQKLKSFNNVKIAWINVDDEKLLVGIESALIQHFNPPLNTRKKWVGKKKTLNFSEQELEYLKQISEKTGRTETDIVREALRCWLSQHRETAQVAKEEKQVMQKSNTGAIAINE